MLLFGVYNEIDALVGEAKWFLIQSRVYAQEAIIHDELDVLYGPNHFPYNMGNTCRRMSKRARRDAKKVLMKIEKLNGALYLEGGRLISLRKRLDGCAFRTWNAYQAVYKSSTLLNGVDPTW